MPPCGLTRACPFLLVVFAATIQDVRAAKAEEHPQIDYDAIVQAYAPEYPYEARQARITGSETGGVKPGTFPSVKIPIRFTMSSEVQTDYHVKESRLTTRSRLF